MATPSGKTCFRVARPNGRWDPDAEVVLGPSFRWDERRE